MTTRWAVDSMGPIPMDNYACIIHIHIHIQIVIIIILHWVLMCCWLNRRMNMVTQLKHMRKHFEREWSHQSGLKITVTTGTSNYRCTRWKLTRKTTSGGCGTSSRLWSVNLVARLSRTRIKMCVSSHHTTQTIGMTLAQSTTHCITNSCDTCLSSCIATQTRCYPSLAPFVIDWNVANAVGVALWATTQGLTKRNVYSIRIIKVQTYYRQMMMIKHKIT